MGAPEKPTIEVPAIRREGQDAMLNGRRMRAPEHPEGFTFCPYERGTIEHANFMAGCKDVAMKTPNV